MVFFDVLGRTAVLLDIHIPALLGPASPALRQPLGSVPPDNRRPQVHERSDRVRLKIRRWTRSAAASAQDVLGDGLWIDRRLPEEEERARQVHKEVLRLVL